MAITGTIVEFPARQVRRRGHEIAFLPAALEVMETPPSPIGRAIGATIIAFFCLALAWAMVGKVDIVAAAPGRIVPDDRVKVIQPFESGVVHAIHVREGASVRAGDVLIELDPTISAAETDHIKSDFVAAELEVARIKAALAGNADPLNDFIAPADASQALVETDRRFLVTQTAEQDAKLAEITRQLAEKQAERETIAATIAKLQATLPPLQERVAVSKNLYDKGLASKMSYLTDLQDLVGQQHDLPVLESRQHEVEAAIAVLEETRSRAKAEYRRTLFDELAKAEQKAAGLAQDMIKAEHRAKMQTLTAPVDGVVQQLSVHTIGGVVTPAQALAVVVPADAALEIEAMVSNSDVGFVSAGQEAEIKVDTFNFTRYGLLHGRVLGISRDAVTNDRRDDAVRDPSSTAESSTTEKKDQEPAYLARVSMDRTQMQIEGRSADLSPGMSVTVEIKTGSRRIISYLLSPLLRYRQEIFRER
ncbi:HlyD family type I secretion periplasmic adaptor subunit [Mesorhizobium australafricanum]|uniref:Membrane fusion protein (MFP) family protein n=1 Tax=Mesorhizobium australafricanum TaxID=3072311 RepID=A0ABU4X0U8_9HYPH|nr:HlyD family type I secretion periplasmic adaptor subunit [Mesorhizobium sp. VK3E]MDX8441941.1 HlyD family type I secretion periplasmic adaptor subunit [Mesorhizobium sp. VK3E]